jgi:hypothetical protein
MWDGKAQHSLGLSCFCVRIYIHERQLSGSSRNFCQCDHTARCEVSDSTLRMHDQNCHGGGTGTVQTNSRKYESYKRARQFVHKLGLRSQQEWKDYCKGKYPHLPPKPDRIPTTPSRTYEGKGWLGTREWLGSNKSVRRR